jgi:hypothetical protein
MTQWHGHTATTSASLLAFLAKAQTSGTRFSHTERVLHTACEFWVAAVNHSLTRYLGNAPKIVLRDAEAGFAAIEIASVANILREARNNLLAATPSISAARVVAQLQQALDNLREPVDEMIGKFAAEQTWSRLKQPTFAAMEFPTPAQTDAQSR